MPLGIGIGISPALGGGLVEPALQPPAAPTNLAATAVSGSQIDLAWTLPAGDVTGVKIERSDGDDENFVQIDSVGAVESYEDTGLSSGIFYYRVRAFNAAGDGDYSNTAPAVVYLLLDEFTSDDAAPITSPRTCEPGPGTLTVAAGDANQLSTSGGKLIYAGGATVDLDIGALARTVGRAIMCNFSLVALGGIDIYYIQPTTGQIRDVVRSDGTNTLLTDGNVSLGNPIVGATTYHIVVVIRSVGSFALVKGGAYTTWRLLRVARTATASLTPRIDMNGANNNISIDDYRVVDLPAPFDSDFGIATDSHAGSQSAGATFTHEANCHIEATITTRPSAGQIELRFRIQDASNYWQVTVDSSGNLDLDEVVAGTPTQRGTAAGVIANGDRVEIIANGTNIRVVETNALRITYTSASNFQTETDGELETLGTGGAVSGIHTFPVLLSGDALAVLEAV